MPQYENEYLSSIVEFRKMFGQHVPAHFHDADEDDTKLQAALIIEEHREWLDSTNRIGAIDGLGDLLYVTVGAFVAAGLSKALQPVLPLQFTTDRKINGYKWPMGDAVRAAVAQLNASPLCQSKLVEKLNALYQAINNAAAYMQFDLVKAFRRIHASNMTKAWSADAWTAFLNQSPDTASLLRAIPVGTNYIVRNRDGKVIKSPDYMPVDLNDL